MIFKTYKLQHKNTFSKEKEIKKKMFWGPSTTQGLPRILLSQNKSIWQIEMVPKPPVWMSALSFDEETKDVHSFHVGLFEWQMRYKNR
jgi:hypothetical protein